MAPNAAFQGPQEAPSRGYLPVPVGSRQGWHRQPSNPPAMRALIVMVLALAPLSGCGYRRAVIAEDHLAAGSRALAAHRWTTASREFSASAALRPGSGQLRARIGLAYEQAGRCGDAIAWLQEAVELQPRQPAVVRVALLTCLEHEGRAQEAGRLLRDALVTYRDDALALNELGYIAADRGIHLDAAARLLRRAAALARGKPYEGVIVDSLGWCYYRQGRFRDALPLMTRAARRASSAEVLYHLGMVHRALGDLPAADTQFSAALSLDPAFAPAYQALMAPAAAQPPTVEQ